MTNRLDRTLAWLPGNLVAAAADSVEIANENSHADVVVYTSSG